MAARVKGTPLYLFFPLPSACERKMGPFENVKDLGLDDHNVCFHLEVEPL